MIDPHTGIVATDPETNKPIIDHHYLAAGRRNFLYVGEVPVFYWPSKHF